MSTLTLVLTAVGSVLLLLFLVMKARMHAFVALMVVSIGAGLFSGMPLDKIAATMEKGMGGTLGFLAIVVALATAADYQDPWLQQQLATHGWALWPPVRFGATTINFASTVPFPSPPSASNWLGTDANGGDVLARILYGTRISVLFGLLLTLFSSVLGVLAGAIQGYYGGKIDLWGQRFIEVWSGMPTLFLIILLSSVVQPGFWWLLAITVLFGWMTLVGVVRAEFLRTRNYDYVRAAQALGVSDRQIILRHMLPNAMVATLTFLPFILCSSITTLTSLDFLGFGLPLGSPSLGELLLQGKNNLQAPWLGIAAFLSVAVLLTLLIFIGEAVRDAFDPSKAV